MLFFHTLNICLTARTTIIKWRPVSDADSIAVTFLDDEITETFNGVEYKERFKKEFIPYAVSSENDEEPDSKKEALIILDEDNQPSVTTEQNTKEDLSLNCKPSDYSPPNKHDKKLSSSSKLKKRFGSLLNLSKSRPIHSSFMSLYKPESKTDLDTQDTFDTQSLYEKRYNSLQKSISRRFGSMNFFPTRYDSSDEFYGSFVQPTEAINPKKQSKISKAFSLKNLSKKFSGSTDSLSSQKSTFSLKQKKCKVIKIEEE
ncbi:hypothetical protein TUBRATIS_23460, partial [Tubulinosema ratisbonensis]